MKSGFTLLEVIVALLLVSIWLRVYYRFDITGKSVSEFWTRLCNTQYCTNNVSRGEKPKNVYTEKFGVMVSSSSTTLVVWVFQRLPWKRGIRLRHCITECGICINTTSSEQKNKNVFTTPLNASATTQATTVQIQTTATTPFTPFPEKYCTTCSIWGSFTRLRKIKSNNISIQSTLFGSGILHAWVTFRTSTPNVVILDMPSALVTSARIRFVYAPVTYSGIFHTYCNSLAAVFHLNLYRSSPRREFIALDKRFNIIRSIAFWSQEMIFSPHRCQIWGDPLFLAYSTTNKVIFSTTSTILQRENLSSK